MNLHSRRIRLSRRRLPLLALCVLLAAPAAANDHTWTGTAGDGQWSNNLNWDVMAPTTGEGGGTICIFGSGTESITDISSLVVDQVRFTGGGNTLAQFTAPLGISGSLLTANIRSDSGANAITALLNLSGANCGVLVSAGTLTLSDTVSGTPGLELLTGSSAGTLILSGGNSYSGATTVTAGALLLNSGAFNGAIPGNLNIGVGLGGPASAVVRLLQISQIADSSTVTVGSDGLLDLNDNFDVIGPLTVNGGTVRMGTGGLVTGNFTLGASSALELTVDSIFSSQIHVGGAVSLGGATLRFSGPLPEFDRSVELIDNNGGSPVSGIFGGLPEGSRLDVNGAEFAMTYQFGPDGNDVEVVPAPLQFFTLAPCRLIDTRDTPSGPTPLADGSARYFTLVGRDCGVPTNARALSVNITAVGATQAGSIDVYAGNKIDPLTPMVHFLAGQTRANNAVVSLATDGFGDVFAQAALAASGAVHLLIDVNGYFKP